MNRSKDFSLILACYNEEPIFEKNIQYIFKTLERSRLNYEIIFVDDVSKDKTKKLIKEVCQKNPKKCRALFHKFNKGRGATVTDGFMEAKGEVIGYIDFDCEVSPVYIPEAVSIIQTQKADVVIGKRIYRTSLKSLVREILSIGYQKLADTLLDVGSLDTESGYKFFNRKKILPLLKYADHPHWFWDTQITVISKKKGLVILEMPVLFLRRFDKKSSVKIFSDTWDYLVNIWTFSRKLKQNSFN
jgi:glycosyltransferase involved in cell wall biosynthesis